MRTSGVYLFHVWRLIPVYSGLVFTKYTVLIDGEEKGEIAIRDIKEAIKLAKLMVEEMLEKGQR